MNHNDDDKARTTSFAGTHPELAGQVPASFKNAPDIGRDFNEVRGSEMVKNDKPFPELKPKYEQQPKREAFNKEWLQEQRRARMADYDWQRERQNAIRDHANDEQQRAHQHKHAPVYSR